MTPSEIRAAREALGLSRADLAAWLEIGSAHDMQRCEMPDTAAKSRPLPARAERLLEAYLAGYRPDGWPGDAS